MSKKIDRLRQALGQMHGAQRAAYQKTLAFWRAVLRRPDQSEMPDCQSTECKF
jgi:hypothetical protein